MEKRKILFTAAIVSLVIVALYYLFTLWEKERQPLTLYGNVDIRDVNLAFRVGGRLSELKVDEGDVVHKGDLIGHIDAESYQRAVDAANALVDQQTAAWAYAQTIFAREVKLRDTGASSADHYRNAVYERDTAKANLERAQAELAQAMLNLKDTNLYASSEGVVLTRVVEPGSMLAAGATVITVSLIDPVWVRAYVNEAELGKAKTGTNVKVYSDSNPNKFYTGKIGFVSSTAEFTPKSVETPDLRTQLVYRLRIVVQDPHHELRQGMPVTVKFDCGKRG